MTFAARILGPAVLGLLLAGKPAQPCYAARPMVTDDARITDAHACQLESWRRSNRDSREFWAFPACNPTGNLEMTLGVNDLPDGGGGRASDMVLQGKTLFRALEPGGYGIGFAAGLVRHADPAPGQGRLSNLYFYVPVSKSLLNDRVVLHLNLGAQRNRDNDSKPLTWGIGTEINFTPRFALIAETYGDNHTRNYYQAGVRFWIIPNRWQIDSTLGAQAGSFGPSRWWTIGVRLITPRFLQ